jgi:hypothetical protein
MTFTEKQQNDHRIALPPAASNMRRATPSEEEPSSRRIERECQRNI